MKHAWLLCIFFLLAILICGCGTQTEVLSGAVSEELNMEPSMEYCVDSSTIQWDSQTLTAVSFAPESMLALCTDDASVYLAVTLNQDGTVSQSVPLSQSGAETPMIITAWDGGFATAAYQVISSDENRLKSVLTVTVYDEAGSTSTQLFSLEGTGCPLFLTAWKDSLFLAVNQEPTTEVCRQADMLYRWKDGTLSQCDVDADVIYSMQPSASGMVLSVGSKIETSGDAEPDWNCFLCCYAPDAQKTEYLMSTNGKVILLGTSNESLYGLVDGGVVLLHPDTDTEERIAGFTELSVSLPESLLGGWSDGTSFFLLPDNGILLTLRETEVPTSRQTVTLGYVDTLSVPETAIAQFNSTSDTYRIALTHYTDAAALGVALSTGGGPDLLDATFLPIDSYREKGVFLDISDQLTRSGYLPSIQQMASEDGKVYVLPLRFGLLGMMVRDDYLSDHPNITLDDLAALPQEELALNAPLETLLDTHPKLFAVEDKAQLVKILTIAKTQQEAQEIAYHPSVLLPYGIYGPSTAADMQQYRQGYTIIGLPDLGGSGMAVYPMSQIAINSAAENLEGARAVLNYLISSEGQKAMGDGEISINDTVLAQQIEDAKIAGLSDNAAVEFQNQIGTADTMVQRNDTVLEIVREEAEAYFNGDKSAAECADVIMNRVSIYSFE